MGKFDFQKGAGLILGAAAVFYIVMMVTYLQL